MGQLLRRIQKRILYHIAFEVGYDQFFFTTVGTGIILSIFYMDGKVREKMEREKRQEEIEEDRIKERFERYVYGEGGLKEEYDVGEIGSWDESG